VNTIVCVRTVKIVVVPLFVSTINDVQFVKSVRVVQFVNIIENVQVVEIVIHKVI
jgi:hypothetical protein